MITTHQLEQHHVLAISVRQRKTGCQNDETKIHRFALAVPGLHDRTDAGPAPEQRSIPSVGLREFAAAGRVGIELPKEVFPTEKQDGRRRVEENPHMADMA